MLKLNTSLQNTVVQAFADLFDVGVDLINIYGGAEPVDANAALGAQVLLASVTLPAPGFGVAATGTVGKVGTWEDLVIDASGTPSFFRLIDNAGGILQGTAGTAGTDMILSSATFTANGTFSINSFSITMPAA